MEPSDNDDIRSLLEEHRNRIFGLYQNKNSNVQKMLAVVIGFTLVFFFLIFMPYISDLKVINELNQNISHTSDLINQNESLVSKYSDVYNGIKQVKSELGEVPTKLGNYVTNIFEQDSSDKIRYENSSSGLTNSIITRSTKLIANESNAYVIFVDDNNHNLMFKAFDTNNNQTQSHSLYNLSGPTLGDDIAVHNSDVYVVWYGGTSDKNPIFFKRITDNGRNISNPILMSENVSSPRDLRLLSSANSVYLIWSDNNDEILFTKSTDNGKKFEPIKKIGNGTLFNVAISNNNIYLVSGVENVQENFIKIYFTRSTDNGKTFQTVNTDNDTVDNSNEHNKDLTDTSVDAQDNNVYIAWNKKSENNTGSKISSIYFKRSEDNGTSFDSVRKIENVSGEILNLQLKKLKNNIYVMWNTVVESEPGGIPLNFDASIKMSFDNGKNFTDKKSIKSKSYPLGSKLFVEPYDVTILSNRENDTLMSRSSASGHTPFNTIVFTNATDVRFYSSNDGNPGLNNIGLNSDGRVYAISGNHSGTRLNIFSRTYDLNKETDNLAFAERTCPKSDGLSSESITTLFQNYKCNVKAVASTLLRNFEPRIQKSIIKPLENINSKNSNVSTLSSDIHSDITKLPHIFDNILSKNYQLIHTIDGRTELATKLLNQKDQFWKRYENKINNLTQQLVSNVNNSKNQIDQLSNKKAQLIKHQNEIIDRLKHIQLPIIGEIPFGISEGMAVYPLILSSGLLILAFMLVDSINMRKIFHSLSNNKDPAKKIFTSQQIAISLPLWIDPISSRTTQVLKFLVPPNSIYLFYRKLLYSLQS